jgi:hypothetical protein
MKKEDEVVTSPLSRGFQRDGKPLTITIYRGTYSDDPWFFEVVDNAGCANVSNEMYETDKAALEAAMTALNEMN